MARRRRNSGLQPLHVILAVVVLALAGGAVYFFSRSGNETAYGDPPFPAAEYQENFFGMRGNRYTVTGTVTEQLRYAPDRTRLFALTVKDGPAGQPCDVGVVVPAAFSSVNIQTGQEFNMRVEVEQDGLLRALDIRKS